MTGRLSRFTRLIFATPLSRELAWALLIKMATLGLIGWVFFRDTEPPATVEVVGNHLLRNNSSDLQYAPSFSQGEPHGIGNRR
jgi:hypothetical protein